MLDRNKNKEFFELLEDVSNYSHAYLFVTDSLKDAYPYVCLFAKKIICENHYNDHVLCGECNICQQIDDLTYDDYYVVNPETITIKKEEIAQLFNEFSKQSIKKNGHRVYVIYGVERMQEEVSNKLLKFLEEPDNNIHALLMTENINALLSTIKSRCQTIKIKVTEKNIDEDIDNNATKFLQGILQNKEKMIGYSYEYVFSTYDTREKFVDFFMGIEEILLNEIRGYNDENYSRKLDNISFNQLLKIVKLTDDLGKLLSCNANINLLIDRYIIEAKDVLMDEENCRNCI